MHARSLHQGLTCAVKSHNTVVTVSLSTAANSYNSSPAKLTSAMTPHCLHLFRTYTPQRCHALHSNHHTPHQTSCCSLATSLCPPPHHHHLPFPCQQAVVQVDETGTEAAAVTSVITLKSAFTPPARASLVSPTSAILPSTPAPSSHHGAAAQYADRQRHLLQW